MEESTKDKIENAAAVGAQAALSALPLVGGPLATIFGANIDNALARRNRRLVNELRADLDRLVAEGVVVDIESVLESDQFLANFTIAFRAMQETSDNERIEQLRNAVVQGIRPKWRSYSERFMNSVVRLTPIHVQVLSVIFALSGGKPKSIQNGTSIVRNELSRDGIHRNEAGISHICDELAIEGFLVASPQTRGDDDKGRRVRLSHDGIRFQAFLAKDGPDSTLLSDT